MKKYYLPALFIVILGVSFFLFGRTISNYFVSDDWHWLSVATSRTNIFPDFFANTAGEHTGGSYNPVASLWINIVHWIAGLNPAPYHVASIVLHAINALLVAILIRSWMKVFVKSHQVSANGIAGLGALLFAAWPTHTEAIVWISSVPHLLQTFFGLMTVISYLLWRTTEKKKFFWLAVITLFLGLASKESALALILMLIGIEISYQLVQRRFELRGFFVHAWFIGVTALYGLLRFKATGLGIGSYADERLIVRLKIWSHTFLTFFEEMFTMGTARASWSHLFFGNPKLLTIAGCGAIFVVAIVLWRKKLHAALTAFILFMIATVPFVPLGFNRLVADGERYTYWPSVFGIIALLMVIYHLKAAYRIIIIAFLLIISVGGISSRVGNWVLAAETSKDIVQRYIPFNADLFDASKTYVAVGLPDTIGGAHLFRNNLREALSLTFPGMRSKIVQIPVYLILDDSNYKGHILSWKSDDRGLIATSVDRSFVVTGVDRLEGELMTHELWNYDYTNFTSDTIRLNFSPDFKKDVLSGTSELLVWNDGATQICYNSLSKSDIRIDSANVDGTLRSVVCRLSKSYTR